MSNPARAPKEYTTQQLAFSSSPDAFLPSGYGDLAKSYKRTETAQALLEKLDMQLAPAIVIPKEFTVDARILTCKGVALATAKVGAISARVRTDHAKRVLGPAYAALPSSGLFSKDIVGAAMRGKVYVDAGTEGALGRLAKAYPARGVRPSRPVSADEADAALRRCGLDMRGLPAPALRPFPLVAKAGEVSVTVNEKSDNGFPVLGQWSTPGAAQLAASLAVSIDEELRATNDVVGWVRRAEAERPYLVAVRGKAKADYYAQAKVVGALMRFYNAFPRQIMLLMQRATQVLEQNSSNILNGGGFSGIGITLVRGGAADLVEALDAQLKLRGEAYVHVGDDSWVVVKRRGVISMFALDCSNFDLTQHSTVTKAVHDAVRAQLRLVDPKSADLWYAFARERLVVVTGSLVRRFTHAGPSGMPLQSKVNDMLMDVMITRTLEALRGGSMEEEEVARVVAKEGAAMGFTVRLEQFWEGRGATLKEALEQRPFLFIGNYFHVRDGKVLVCCDVSRTYAQVPYPSLKWCKTNKDLQVMEAMRLGSIALNLGMPTRELEGSFEAFRHEAGALLELTLAKFGDSSDERLRWAVQESPFGDTTVPSLSGLLRAVRRDPARLWLFKEPELITTSELLPIPGTSWADEVEREEENEAKQLGLSLARPLADLSIGKLWLPKSQVPTHPASVANDGRPPPTVVWGPPKDPKSKAPSRRERRKDLVGREYRSALEEELWQRDHEWSEEYSD